MSCTFDLADEVCPRKNETNERIHHGMQADKTRPISDHTRGGEMSSDFSNYYLLF
jgi:hypothetical protein